MDSQRTGIRTPDKVGSIVKGQKTRWEFPRADHGGEDKLSSVVDAISRNGDLFRGSCHDGRCEAEHIMAVLQGTGIANIVRRW
jgi:hypothetical protein